MLIFVDRNSFIAWASDFYGHNDMDIVSACLVLVAGTIRFNTSITARNVRLYDDLYGRFVWLIDEPCFQRQWRPYPRRSQDAFHSLGTHEVAVAHRDERESEAAYS